MVYYAKHQGIHDIEKLVFEINKNYYEMIKTVNKEHIGCNSKRNSFMKNFELPLNNLNHTFKIMLANKHSDDKQMIIQKAKIQKHMRRKKLDDLFSSNFDKIVQNNNFEQIYESKYIDKILKKQTDLNNLENPGEDVMESKHEIKALIQKYKDWNEKPTVYLLNFFMEEASEGFSEGEEYYKYVKKIQEKLKFENFMFGTNYQQTLGKVKFKDDLSQLQKLGKSSCNIKIDDSKKNQVKRMQFMRNTYKRSSTRIFNKLDLQSIPKISNKLQGIKVNTKNLTGNNNNLGPKTNIGYNKQNFSQTKYSSQQNNQFEQPSINVQQYDKLEIYSYKFDIIEDLKVHTNKIRLFPELEESFQKSNSEFGELHTVVLYKQIHDNKHSKTKDDNYMFKLRFRIIYRNISEKTESDKYIITVEKILVDLYNPLLRAKTVIDLNENLMIIKLIRVLSLTSEYLQQLELKNMFNKYVFNLGPRNFFVNFDVYQNKQGEIC